ncbi:MAG: hypothetical protein O2783_04635 [Chloroflexi bacterium]|nr:hypothetical protein [Chloroflexota bacterium]
MPVASLNSTFGIGVEGRIQVHQVYRLIREIVFVPQERQIISLVQDIGIHSMPPV